MKSNRFLTRGNNITSDFQGEGEICPRCREYKGVECLHDFDSDPKRIWEVIFCSFCGQDIHYQDITAEYQAEAERRQDEWLESLSEESRLSKKEGQSGID